jgi:hypothetical protein
MEVLEEAAVAVEVAADQVGAGMPDTERDVLEVAVEHTAAAVAAAAAVMVFGAQKVVQHDVRNPHVARNYYQG